MNNVIYFLFSVTEMCICMYEYIYNFFLLTLNRVVVVMNALCNMFYLINIKEGKKVVCCGQLEFFLSEVLYK